MTMSSIIPTSLAATASCHGNRTQPAPRRARSLEYSTVLTSAQRQEIRKVADPPRPRSCSIGREQSHALPAASPSPRDQPSTGCGWPSTRGGAEDERLAFIQIRLRRSRPPTSLPAWVPTQGLHVRQRTIHLPADPPLKIAAQVETTLPARACSPTVTSCARMVRTGVASTTRSASLSLPAQGSVRPRSMAPAAVAAGVSGRLLTPVIKAPYAALEGQRASHP